MNVVLLMSGPFLLLLVAAVLRLMAIAQPETAASGKRRYLLIWISYLSLTIAVAGMTFLLFVVGFIGAFGLFLALMTAVVIGETEVRFAGVRNRSRQAEFLWVLALAIKSGRPLADEIEAYAQGTWGKRRRLLTEMAHRLRDGESLTELVVPQGLLPISAGMQIHSGISSQSLEESLIKTAARTTHDLADDYESDFPGAGLAYPPALLVIVSLVVGFMMYYIVPKLKRIFDDFNTELPDVTVGLIRYADLVVNYWFIVGLPILVYVPLGIVAVVALAQYYGWQTLLQSFFGRWWLRWHSADVLRALSQGVAQGQSVKAGLEPIVRYAGPLRLRKKLAMAVDAIDDGAPEWQSLEKIGILKHQETALLETAQRLGNLQWVLETLATNIERQRTFRIRAILELLQPAMILPIGILIGIIAIALFLPLVKLLHDLS